MTERWKDIHFDLIAIVAQGRGLKVQSWVPLVYPVDECKLSTTRINVCMVTDGCFLIAPIILCRLRVLNPALDSSVPLGLRQRARQRFPRFSAYAISSPRVRRRVAAGAAAASL